MIKSFGEWGLYGAFGFEVGGIDRSRPLSADLSFDVGVGQERRMESALGLGIVAEALLFYRSFVKPRDFTKLPPPPDSETESRVAKHAIKAQLCFFNLLMEDLAETWCVEEGKER
jgi:hypothetical protein